VTGQTAEKVIDGVVDGMLRVSPTVFGDSSKEWKINGETDVGAWIELQWAAPVRIDRVLLYDRVSCKAHITGGLLTFSDNTTVAVGALENIGTATEVVFSPRFTASLRFTITAMDPTSTWEAGLAEIEVYETSSVVACRGDSLPPEKRPRLVREQNSLLPRPYEGSPLANIDLLKDVAVVYPLHSAAFFVLLLSACFVLYRFQHRQRKRERQHF